MAVKTSLRDYQRELAERLRNAGSTLGASKLGLRVGAESWLVDLADAGEVLSVPPITPVPLTRSWFKGVVNVRGNLYSVVDFPAFLGGAPVTPGEQSRLLVLAERFGLATALLVERALGLRQLREFSIADGAGDAWTRARYTDRDGHSWKELDVAQLAQHPDFMHVAT
jgi:twitching motility protein PilI